MQVKRTVFFALSLVACLIFFGLFTRTTQAADFVAWCYPKGDPQPEPLAGIDPTHRTTGSEDEFFVTATREWINTCFGGGTNNSNFLASYIESGPPEKEKYRIIGVDKDSALMSLQEKVPAPSVRCLCDKDAIQVNATFDQTYSNIVDIMANKLKAECLKGKTPPVAVKCFSRQTYGGEMMTMADFAGVDPQEIFDKFMGKGFESAAPGTKTPEKLLPNPLNTTNPSDIIGRIIKFIVGISGSFALLMFVYGGFMWLMSSGNPQWIDKGKSAIKYAVIGLAVVFSSYIIVRVIVGATSLVQ